MFKDKLPYIAWTQALVATFVSLYFSEVMHLPPCVLCWYQRILMYPIVLIAAVGIIRRDKALATYVLPLSITGWLISLYHNLLHYKIIPESITPCQLGVSCTTRQIEWFGFITIPLLSLIVFTVINVCFILYHRSQRTRV